MAARVTSCPNCGGSVEFKAGTSLLAVCSHCSSAVARVGDDITEAEVLGRVAPLADLGSPLHLGMRGRYGALEFTLVGQAQYDHGAGPWNEWYAAFEDGRYGWLAEAQGELFVSFPRAAVSMPSWSTLSVGQRVQIGAHELVVAEMKTARFVAASGELPFWLAPGASFRYADLRGERGNFATADFGRGESLEQLFLGRSSRYDQHFSADQLADTAPTEAALAIGLNCPNCGAGLELRAPDEARRVTCSTCDSVLDVQPGSPLHLFEAAARSIPEPLIPLGASGALDGDTWTVYGQVQRSAQVDGETFSWIEYLLRGEASRRWRWLLESDGHWTLSEEVEAGRVRVENGRARLDARRFTFYASVRAVVVGFRGEFYWKLAVGDMVSATDYLDVPELLSEERSADEVHYSLGRYVEAAVLEQAFGLKDRLPKPVGIAPHQPNPFRRTLRGLTRSASLVSLLVLLMAGVRWGMADEAEVHRSEVVFTPRAEAKKGALVTPARPIGPIRFDVPAGRNLAVEVTSDGKIGALYLSAQLTNLDLGRTRSFGLRVEEPVGALRRRRLVVGETGSGHFELTLVPEWMGLPAAQPKRIEVKVLADVFVGSHVWFALGLAWILPLVGVFRAFGFAKKRWVGGQG